MEPERHIEFSHWGNVPGGVTDPKRMGGGVAGRDQGAAKGAGLAYTSAVVKGSQYSEPAVQKGKKQYSIRIPVSKVYDASNWRNDPRFHQALASIQSTHGNDIPTALAEYQKSIAAQGYDASTWANGQARIYTPQIATEEVTPESKALADALRARGSSPFSTSGS
jgi:hypothetical protein